MPDSRPSNCRGFTLIELMAVVVLLAILAAVAVPRFFNNQSIARESACRGILANVRQGMANFYLNEAIGGTAAYPSQGEMGTVGTVMQEILPDNPYNGLGGIRALTLGDAAIRWTDGTTGWCYAVNNGLNPPQAVFWANSSGSGENNY